MMEGTVKFFDSRKNYGFINPDEGDEDLFVHASDIESGSLKEDDRVGFESEEGEKGPRAVKVNKIEN
ncbi:cold-shock protein [candidate division MSBL1 archaeon SCGC-AAA382A13]|uniref:Cold-shock protein n=2 Tax=candidate division MSBL1 TaxID=215777 RepID=A0A133VES3_9EURY|nr:cold-shock protein [candidate division MSBL1 archaeon SCGC-AAA382A03]KXB05254.1 cold-shock protein [candidate division MSBL1 archaeon SCGC-AAA382A13]